MKKKELELQLAQTRKALEEANNRIKNAYPEKERYEHITRLMCSHVILSEILYDYDAMIALTVKEHPKSETIKNAYDHFCTTVPRQISALQTLSEEYRFEFHKFKRDSQIVWDLLNNYNTFFRAINEVNDSINRLVNTNLGTLHRDLQDPQPGLPLPKIVAAPITPTQSPVAAPEPSTPAKPEYPLQTWRDAAKDVFIGFAPYFFIILLIILSYMLRQ